MLTIVSIFFTSFLNVKIQIIITHSLKNEKNLLKSTILNNNYNGKKLINTYSLFRENKTFSEK